MPFRSVIITEPPPPPYTPPTIPPAPTTPPPAVADRVTQGTAEVLLPGVDGKRYWGWGHQRIAGKLQYTFKAGTNDVWLVIEIARGKAHQLVQCTINGTDATLLPGIQFWFYDGTQVAADSHLAAVDATWNEVFAGTCYAVVHLSGLDQNWPQIPNPLWEVKLGEPTDPTTGLTGYTENLFIHWYNFEIDAEGGGLDPSTDLDAAAWIAAIAIGAQTVGGRLRYEGHPLLMQAVDVEDVRKMFRLATDSYFFWEAGKLKVICDRPGSSVATYGASALSTSSRPTASRDDDTERPNHIILQITDTTNDWKTKAVEWKSAALLAGTEDDLSATYQMPWVHNDGVGISRASYIGNSYLYDLKLRARWNETTAGQKLGDIVTQAIDDRGLTFVGRLVSRQKQSKQSLYDVVLLEYNAGRYADDTTGPTAKTPSTFPLPGDVPPNVSGFTGASIVEELYLAVDTYFSRAKIEITNPNFYFLDAVELWVSINGGSYRYYGDFPRGSAAVVDLFYDSINDIGVPYTFKLITRSTFGVKSAGVTATKTFTGKATVPSDVLGLTAGANNGHAYLTWQPSADFDVKTYEIRKGLSTDTWSTATYVGQTAVTAWLDPSPYSTSARYFVKASDGINYSANAAIFDVTLNAVGGITSELEYGFTPDASFSNPAPGLWVSGSLVLQSSHAFVSQPDGSIQAGNNSVLAFLTRTDSPATAETERAAAGCTVDQWATNIDDPRRGGAPLWAPLPANAQGEIWGSFMVNGFGRLREHRARFQSVTHSGIDTPTNVAIAQPFFLDTSTPTVRQYGSVYSAPPGVTTLGIGLRLSTNSKYYQQIVSSAIVQLPNFTPPPPNAMMTFAVASEVKPFVVASGAATSDASGLATISFSYSPLAGLSHPQCYTITGIAGSTTGYIVTLDHLDAAAQTARFKVRDTTGAAASGVVFSYSIIDNGASFAFVVGVP